jgi:hypothetical protein
MKPHGISHPVILAFLFLGLSLEYGISEEPKKEDTATTEVDFISESLEKIKLKLDSKSYKFHRFLIDKEQHDDCWELHGGNFVNKHWDYYPIPYSRDLKLISQNDSTAKISRWPIRHSENQYSKFRKLLNTPIAKHDAKPEPSMVLFADGESLAVYIVMKKGYGLHWLRYTRETEFLAYHDYSIKVNSVLNLRKIYENRLRDLNKSNWKYYKDVDFNLFKYSVNFNRIPMNAHGSLVWHDSRPYHSLWVISVFQMDRIRCYRVTDKSGKFICSRYIAYDFLLIGLFPKKIEELTKDIYNALNDASKDEVEDDKFGYILFDHEDYIAVIRVGSFVNIYKVYFAGKTKIQFLGQAEMKK